MLSFIMLSVAFCYWYAWCHYTDCHYAAWHGAHLHKTLKYNKNVLQHLARRHNT
jgi:hypothetical protein